MKNVVVVFLAESLLEIISESRSQRLYKPIGVKSVTNAIDEVEVSTIFLLYLFFADRW